MRKNAALIFIALYVFIGLVPYLQSIDKRYIQILYLSILNCISLSYIVYNYKDRFYKVILDKIKLLPVFLFFAFLLWSTLSFINAVNLGEYFFQTNFYFQQLLSFVFILFFLAKLENFKNYIKILIVSLTSIELITSFFPYIVDIFFTGDTSARSLAYRGFTGSVNMISYTLLMKLPFIYYYTLEKGKINLFYSFLSVLIIYDIFYVFETRSAILSSFIVSVMAFILIALSLIKTNKNIKQSLSKAFIASLAPTILAILIGSMAASQLTSQRNIDERLSSLNTEDYSFSSRYRFYTQAIESIIENPIFGIGNGNWELESIKRDADFIVGYTVPYHVHNDYLEIAAESGIIAAVLYYGMIFYVLFLLLRSLMIKMNLNKEFHYETILIISISAYLMDSMFNFPTSRPYVQMAILFILSVSIIYLNDKVYQTKFSLNRLVVYLLILIIPLSVYTSLRIYSSAVEQNTLLRKYNFAQADISMSLLDEMETNFPSITATTVPLKSMKGFFLFKNGKYEEAKKLLKEGKKYNPYLSFEEAWLSQIYYELEDYDSAKYYGKIAYEKIPNNILHFAHVAQSLMRLKDSIGLKDLYQNHEKMTPSHEEFYITALAAIIGKDDSGFADGIDSLATTDLSKKAFYTLKVGYEDTMKAGSFHVLAQEYFDKEDYAFAAAYWDQARQLNPFELPYKENYGITLLRLDRNDEALQIFNELIEDSNLESLKPYYLRGLLLIQKDKKEEGCADLEIAYRNGLLGTSNIYQQLCGEFQ